MPRLAYELQQWPSYMLGPLDSLLDWSRRQRHLCVFASICSFGLASSFLIARLSACFIRASYGTWQVFPFHRCLRYRVACRTDSVDGQEPIILNIMYDVRCTMYDVQCTMYDVQCTMKNG